MIASGRFGNLTDDISPVISTTGSAHGLGPDSSGELILSQLVSFRREVSDRLQMMEETLKSMAKCLPAIEVESEEEAPGGYYASDADHEGEPEDE